MTTPRCERGDVETNRLFRHKGGYMNTNNREGIHREHRRYSHEYDYTK